MTCHDILIGCHPDPRRPAANPDFLRGWPAESLSAWCATCHTDLFDHGRHNPHIMLTDEGQLIERACRFCHYSPRTAGLKPAELERRIGEADLVRDDITLCLSCHATHREWFEPGHIGTRMTADIKKRLLEFESRLAAGGETDIRPTDDEVRPWLLPLAEGDIIVCATCHNPHQDGVFPPGSALSAGAIAFPRREDELPLRGLGKDLCSACHDR